MKTAARAAVLAALTGLASAVSAGPSVHPLGLTRIDPRMYIGLTLFDASSGQIVLIDPQGNFVQVWNPPDPGDLLQGGEPILDSPGHILVRRNTLGIGSETLSEMDFFGTIVWEVDAPQSTGRAGEVAGTYAFHHDYERLSNGNTLVLCSYHVNDPAISDKTIQDDCIFEYDASGNIVWQWYLGDHFDEMGFSPEQKALIAAQNPGPSGVVDWAHANSMVVIPPNPFQADSRFTPGNILVNLRATNTMHIIDRITGEIVWQIGPSETFTIGQHFPHFNPIVGLPTDGMIIVFDNGGEAGYPAKFRSWSRVLEIDPLTKAIVEEYDAQKTGKIQQTFFSHIISGAQRLPNGNMLVVEGTSGRIFELTPDLTEILWEYVTSFSRVLGANVKSVNIYRAYRLPTTWLPSGFPG